MLRSLSHFAQDAAVVGIPEAQHAVRASRQKAPLVGIEGHGAQAAARPVSLSKPHLRTPRRSHVQAEALVQSHMESLRMPLRRGTEQQGRPDAVRACVDPTCLPPVCASHMMIVPSTSPVTTCEQALAQAEASLMPTCRGRN